MLKYLAVPSVLFVLTMAQRSPYAGSPNRPYPQVLPQYLPESAATPDVAQRFGEANGPAGDSSPSNYEPYNPYEDQALLDRIATWPKDKQPFWYLNREAIKAGQRQGTASAGNLAPITTPLPTTTPAPITTPLPTTTPAPSPAPSRRRTRRQRATTPRRSTPPRRDSPAVCS